MNPIRHRFAHFALALGALGAGAASEALPDRLLADFEGADYGEWRAIGSAFGRGPNQDPVGGERTAGGFRGQGRASSDRDETGGTGILRSPPIRIEHRYINLLLAGPDNPGRAGLRVAVAGRVVRIITGQDPGFLNTATVDLSPWRGRDAVLEFYDDDPTPGGVLHADHLVASDRPAVPPSDRSGKAAPSNPHPDLAP